MTIRQDGEVLQQIERALREQPHVEVVFRNPAHQDPRFGAPFEAEHYAALAALELVLTMVEDMANGYGYAGQMEAANALTRLAEDLRGQP